MQSRITPRIEKTIVPPKRIIKIWQAGFRLNPEARGKNILVTGRPEKAGSRDAPGYALIFDFLPDRPFFLIFIMVMGIHDQQGFVNRCEDVSGLDEIFIGAFGE